MPAKEEVCPGLVGQPVTSHLLTLRNDILATTRAFFPKSILPTVDSHDGDWGEDEIARYSKCAPAIILVYNGGKSQRVGGTINVHAIYDAFIFTKGRTQKQRTDGAIQIYEHFLKLVHDTDWCTDEFVKCPEEVQSKNLYGSDIDELGVALWVVRWEQLVQVPYTTAQDLETCLDDFARLYVTNTTARPTEDPPDINASEQQIDLETT